MSHPSDRSVLPIPPGLVEPVLTAPLKDDHSTASTKPVTPAAASRWPWTPTWIVILSISAFTASLLVMLTHAREGFFVPVLATVVCILAALFDAWTSRIPNPLTYTAILLGLAASAVGAGL